MIRRLHIPRGLPYHWFHIPMLLTAYGHWTNCKSFKLFSGHLLISKPWEPGFKILVSKFCVCAAYAYVAVATDSRGWNSTLADLVRSIIETPQLMESAADIRTKRA